MKKILSILWAVILTASGASSVIDCGCKKNQYHKDYLDYYQIQQNNKIINQINQQAQKQINTNLFNNVFDSSLKSDLSYIYDKVNENNETYELNWVNDQNILIYFLNEYKKKFNKINENIIKEYTNYYQNSYPISFDKKYFIFKIKYFNKNEFIKKIDINIIKNNKKITNFNLVGLEIQINYKIKYKNLSNENQIKIKTNIVNDVNLFNIINEEIINIFQNELTNWLNNISKIDLKITLNKLYVEFDIDYNKNVESIDNKFKQIFKNFINTNIKLNSFNIKFNNNINFLSKVSTLFENYEQDLLSFKGNIKLNPDIMKKYGNSYLPHQWISTGLANTLENFNLDNFLRKYKEIITAFNLKEAQELELGKFNLNLSFINLYGLNLNGLIKHNNKNFEARIILKKDDLEKNLKSFLNIIIAWYKYFNINFKANKYSIKISNELFKK